MRGLFFREILLLDEREEPHEARALDSGFYSPLLLGGKPTLGATYDATVRINELLQKVDVFVVDVLDIILGKNVVAHRML